MRFHDVVINGETYNLPSVTSIIGLARERKYLVGDEYLTFSEETVGFGSYIHELIAFLLEGVVLNNEAWATFKEPTRQSLRAFKRWWDFTGYKPREVEFEVYSIKHAFVGHPDTRGIIKQHVSLIDWTTGGIYTGKRIQLGAYYLAYLEMYPRRKITEARIVELNKQTGNFKQEIIDRDELEQLARDFISIRQEIGII